MPIPFLEKRKVAGLIIQRRTPDGGHEDTPENHSEDGLRSCAQDLIKAVQTGNEERVAKALRDAFEILDSEPHEEGPHMNDENQTEGSGE